MGCGDSKHCFQMMSCESGLVVLETLATPEVSNMLSRCEDDNIDTHVERSVDEYLDLHESVRFTVFKESPV
jgi:hypothetical protein